MQEDSDVSLKQSDRVTKQEQTCFPDHQGNGSSGDYLVVQVVTEGALGKDTGDISPGSSASKATKPCICD